MHAGTVVKNESNEKKHTSFLLQMAALQWYRKRSEDNAVIQQEGKI